MQYTWRWSVLFADPSLGWLLTGLGWTLSVSACAWLIAFPVGLLAGVARTSASRMVRVAAGTYIEVFRGIPLLVQLFLWYFVFPELVPRHLGDYLKRDLWKPEFVMSAIALGFYTSARIAEQVRASINSIAPSLKSAALSTGLSGCQTYGLVLVPMGVRIAMPTLTSEALAVLKNSSVALTVGLLELTAQARRIENYTFQAFEAFAAATLIYLLFSLLTVWGSRALEARLRMPGYIA